jgi:hypothetical protein
MVNGRRDERHSQRSAGTSAILDAGAQAKLCKRWLTFSRVTVLAKLCSGEGGKMSF